MNENSCFNNSRSSPAFRHCFSFECFLFIFSCCPVHRSNTEYIRIKHVSFARSHTLTSFDEAVVRSVSRVNSSKSQERLIGGKKPILLTHTNQPHHIHHHHRPLETCHRNPLPVVTPPAIATRPYQQLTQTFSSTQELSLLEKLKRHAMKTQATQTEVSARKQILSNNHLSLSPRTMHRVRHHVT